MHPEVVVDEILDWEQLICIAFFLLRVNLGARCEVVLQLDRRVDADLRLKNAAKMLRKRYGNLFLKTKHIYIYIYIYMSSS